MIFAPSKWSVNSREAEANSALTAAISSMVFALYDARAAALAYWTYPISTFIFRHKVQHTKYR